MQVAGILFRGRLYNGRIRGLCLAVQIFQLMIMMFPKKFQISRLKRKCYLQANLWLSFNRITDMTCSKYATKDKNYLQHRKGFSSKLSEL